jgi:plasmid segregation protein ParM
MITGNVIPVDPGQDARLNNVKGYLKYGRYTWGDSGQEGDSTPPENQNEGVATIREDELSQS